MSDARYVRETIERHVSSYSRAGVVARWANTHRANVLHLFLGDATDQVHYARAPSRADLPKILRQVRGALRRIGATQVDLHAIQVASESRSAQPGRDAFERLFDSSVRVTRK